MGQARDRDQQDEGQPAQRVSHASFCLDLPGGWSDESQLLFVAPRREPALPTLTEVTTPTEAVSVHFAARADGDVKAVLAASAASLQTVDEAFAVLAEESFTCRLGQGWLYKQRLHVGQTAVIQLSAAVAVGPLILLATASAAEGRFGKVEGELRAILESMGSTGGQHDDPR